MILDLVIGVTACELRVWSRQISAVKIGLGFKFSLCVNTVKGILVNSGRGGVRASLPVKRWRVFVANRSAFEFGGSVVSGCALYLKAKFFN